MVWWHKAIELCQGKALSMKAWLERDLVHQSEFTSACGQVTVDFWFVSVRNNQ